MGRGRVVLKVGAGLIGLVLVGVGGAAAWAKMTRDGILATEYETHRVEFPIPFPLTEDEIAELREQKRAELPEDAPEDAPEAADPLADVDLEAIALERARERGQHYVEARYACGFCHGADFSGGTMIDDPMIGTWMGPNITTGGRTAGYSAADWDRAVRHGVLPDGRGSVMPTSDFLKMSDRELSDVVAYIQSLPAVEREVPRPTFGPLGTMLMATGQLVPDVAKIEDHFAEHPDVPPSEEVNAEFGQHLAQICSGCHRETMVGGPMPFGPPDWPPAANLTPHEEGLAGWSYDDFRAALLEAKRPDGTPLRAPMNEVPAVAKNMTDTEMQAMWAFFQSLPPAPTGE